MIQICNVRPSITNPRRLAILDNSHDAEAAELITVQYNPAILSLRSADIGLTRLSLNTLALVGSHSTRRGETRPRTSTSSRSAGSTLAPAPLAPRARTTAPTANT